jgi:hypothetical protein
MGKRQKTQYPVTGPHRIGGCPASPPATRSKLVTRAVRAATSPKRPATAWNAPGGATRLADNLRDGNVHQVRVRSPC